MHCDIRICKTVMIIEATLSYCFSWRWNKNYARPTKILLEADFSNRAESLGGDWWMLRGMRGMIWGKSWDCWPLFQSVSKNQAGFKTHAGTWLPGGVGASFDKWKTWVLMIWDRGIENINIERQLISTWRLNIKTRKFLRNDTWTECTVASCGESHAAECCDPVRHQ